MPYYSSEEKDALRQHFDTRLVLSLRRRKSRPLCYFGLPGAEARDLLAWQDAIGHIAAVEMNSEELEKLELLLGTQLPHIRYSTHWGEVDKVILTDRGTARIIGGQHYRPRVANIYADEIQSWAWDFDVVNLDYFGPFLPYDPGTAARGSRRARTRTLALRRLFDPDRQDARRRWLLLVTVEAQIRQPQAWNDHRTFLSLTRDDSSGQAADALDFLLTPGADDFETAARLVAGTSAVLISIAATDAHLRVQPRGVVVYRGAGGQPMVHLAYEFTPAQGALPIPVSRLTLLRCPLLNMRDPLRFPWFQLTPQQVPGLSHDDARAYLDFLGQRTLGQILADASASLPN